MLAAGIGIVLTILVTALVRIAVLLGGAYALTTYVELPSLVDGLVWLGAGGYAVVTALGAFTVLAALAATGSQQSSINRLR